MRRVALARLVSSCERWARRSTERLGRTIASSSDSEPGMSIVLPRVRRAPPATGGAHLVRSRESAAIPARGVCRLLRAQTTPHRSIPTCWPLAASNGHSVHRRRVRTEPSSGTSSLTRALQHDATRRGCKAAAPARRKFFVDRRADDVCQVRSWARTALFAVSGSLMREDDTSSSRPAHQRREQLRIG